MQESQDEWQKKTDGVIEIKLEKEQSKDPTMIEWQDQRRIETRHETEDELSLIHI